MQIGAIETSQSQGRITPEQLATNWNIDLDTARRTVEVTTQRGVRTVSNPSLSRRYRTNDRQLRYRRIPFDMFSDAMIASVPSWHRRNQYAQVFGIPNGWARACLLYTSDAADD